MASAERERRSVRRRTRQGGQSMSIHSGSVRWLQRTVVLVALLVLLSALAQGVAAQSTSAPPAEPQQGETNIYYGSIPPGADSKPVLVFVHGLGGVAADWWAESFYPKGDTNDMYAYAYSRGYRTAFVNVNESGERSPGNDMWVNGRTLARQIEAIARRYGVDKVDVVAHSKGGIDILAAIVGGEDFQGVAHRIRNVFTLSTPHQGSELADFATGRGKSLLEQIPDLPFDIDGAMNVLTTTSMAEFRDHVRSTIQNQPIRYFTAAGNDWGLKAGQATGLGGSSVSSGFLRISGSVLQGMAGDNDGLVSVNSSKLTGLPCASVLFVQPLHHFNMMLGRNSFPWIDAAIRRTGNSGGCNGSQSGGTVGALSFLAPGSPLSYS
jgi:pimeloyl-ACP methyl ester carboxylesterase